MDTEFYLRQLNLGYIGVLVFINKRAPVQVTGLFGECRRYTTLLHTLYNSLLVFGQWLSDRGDRGQMPSWQLRCGPPNSAFFAF